MDNPTRWTTCRIGSCQRHQGCMYTPCRGGETDDQARAQTSTDTPWINLRGRPCVS